MATLTKRRTETHPNIIIPQSFGTSLGSTSVTTNASGQCTSAQWYYAYGNVRTPAPNVPCSGTLPTDFTFTGQRRDASAGLMYYGARYYDSALGRFITADTIVPQAGDPQALNRYSYVGNNPLKFTDPSGHCWGAASGARSLPSYDVTCGNLDMALTIVQHPNASGVEKAFAGWYIATEGTAHVALAVGGSILAWQAIAPAAGATEAACMDGDCTNEARAVSHGTQVASEQVLPAINLLDPVKIAQASQTVSSAGTTVLGRFPFANNPGFQAVAQKLGANAMNVPDRIWNSLSAATRWDVNRAFLDTVIKRGDTIRLSSSYGEQMKFTYRLLANGTKFHDLPGFSKELLYLYDHGYRLSTRLIDGEWVEFLVR